MTAGASSDKHRVLDTFWAHVGKVLTVVGLIVTILVGIKTLLPAREALLALEGTASHFFDPPDDMGSLDQAYPRMIGRSGGLLVGAIINRGSRPATQVRLTVPFGVVAVRDEGGNPVVRTLGTGTGEGPLVMQIAEVRPDQVIRVWVWTVNAGFDGISLTHSEGSGRIKLNRPVGVVGQFADRHAVLILRALVACLAAFLVSKVMIAFGRRRRA